MADQMKLLSAYIDLSIKNYDKVAGQLKLIEERVNAIRGKVTVNVDTSGAKKQIDDLGKSIEKAGSKGPSANSSVLGIDKAEAVTGTTRAIREFRGELTKANVSANIARQFDITGFINKFRRDIDALKTSFARAVNAGNEGEARNIIKQINDVTSSFNQKAKSIAEQAGNAQRKADIESQARKQALQDERADAQESKRIAIDKLQSIKSLDAQIASLNSSRINVLRQIASKEAELAKKSVDANNIRSESHNKLIRQLAELKQESSRLQREESRRTRSRDSILTGSLNTAAVDEARQALTSFNRDIAQLRLGDKIKEQLNLRAQVGEFERELKRLQNAFGTALRLGDLQTADRLSEKILLLARNFKSAGDQTVQTARQMKGAATDSAKAASELKNADVYARRVAQQSFRENASSARNALKGLESAVRSVPSAFRPFAQSLVNQTGLANRLSTAIRDFGRASVAKNTAEMQRLTGVMSNLAKQMEVVASRSRVAASALTQASSAYSKFATSVPQISRSLTAGISGALGSAGSTVTSFVGSLGRVSSAITGITNSISGLVGSIGSGMQSALGIVSSSVSAIGGLFRGLGAAISTVSSILGSLSAAASALGTVLGVVGAAAAVVSGVLSVLGTIVVAATGVLQGLITVVGSALAVVGALGEAVLGLVKAAGEVVGAIGRAGAAIVQFTVNALRPAVNSVLDFVFPLRGLFSLLGDIRRRLGPFIASFIAFQGIRKVGQDIAEFESALTRAASNAESASVSFNEAFNSFNSYVRNVANTTQFTAGEAAQSLDALVRAGFEADQALAALRPSLDLSLLTGTGTSEASETLGRIVQGFGLAAGQAENVIDSLVSAAKQAPISMQDIAISLNRTAASARLFNLDFTTVTAAITRFGEAGIRGERAGTALVRGLERLVSPSIEVQKALNEILQTQGKDYFSFFDDQGALKNGRESLLDLIDTFDKARLAGNVSNTLLTQIFGARSREFATLFLGQFDQATGQYISARQKLEEILGEVEKAQADNLANTATSRLQLTFDALLRQIQGLVVAIGQVIADVFGDDLRSILITVVGQFQRMLAILQQSQLAAQAFQLIRSTIASVSAAVSPLIGYIIRLNVVIGATLVAGITKAAEMFSGPFLSALRNVIGLVTQFFGLPNIGLDRWDTTVQGIIFIFQNFGQIVQRLILTLQLRFYQLFNVSLQYGSAALGVLSSSISGFLTLLKQGFTVAGIQLSQGIAALGPVLARVFEAIVELVGGILVRGLVGSVVSALKQMAVVFNNIPGAEAFFDNIIQPALDSLYSGISNENLFVRFGQNIKNALGGATDTLSNIFNAANTDEFFQRGIDSLNQQGSGLFKTNIAEMQRIIGQINALQFQPVSEQSLILSQQLLDQLRAIDSETEARLRSARDIFGSGNVQSPDQNLNIGSLDTLLGVTDRGVQVNTNILHQNDRHYASVQRYQSDQLGLLRSIRDDLKNVGALT